MSDRVLSEGEAALRATLDTHRGIATGLLVLMAGLLLLAYLLPPSYAADLLAASAKAGLVGGIADWFAVTALFRHPLGLPIPHTAIIPRQKERLGRGLGRFVANHVFTEAEVSRVLAKLDLVGVLQRFLSDPATSRPAAIAAAAALPRMMGSIEDGRANRFLRRMLPKVITGPAAARMLARVLRALIAGGQHQAVFSLAVGEIKKVLASREESLRRAIEEKVREEGGVLVGWLAGAAVAKRVLHAVNVELEKVEPEDSDLRAAFEVWLGREIERLESDPQAAEVIGYALRQALAHPSVQPWIADVWARLREAVARDAVLPDGRALQVIEGMFGNIATLIAEDPTARAKLNAAAETVVAALIPGAQTQLADFIAGVVMSWDTATVTEKIELRVGRDLQFVRINGTLVGFLVGGALFVLLHALFGRVAI
jgi:uncharacterized membrane-anchored protein YjiN (DUF445 family)